MRARVVDLFTVTNEIIETIMKMRGPLNYNTIVLTQVSYTTQWLVYTSVAGVNSGSSFTASQLYTCDD